MPKSKATKSTDKSADSLPYDVMDSPRLVSLKVTMMGSISEEYAHNFSSGTWVFLTVFNGQIVLEHIWTSNEELVNEGLALNLKLPEGVALVSNLPLIFLMKPFSNKHHTKELDVLMNADNKIGATVDLYPLAIGEQEIKLTVPLVFIDFGQFSGCSVIVEVQSTPGEPDRRTLITMTMLSAHCLPPIKEGSTYISGISLDGVQEPPAVQFGMSLSMRNASKDVWASACAIGCAASTGNNVPNDDCFIPLELNPIESEKCVSTYWNSMKRALVDAEALKKRLEKPLYVEVAGVPRFGKLEARGRYMGYLDAKILLEPGIYGATIAVKLSNYNQKILPEGIHSVLDFPPTSAKASANVVDSSEVVDEFGNATYIKLRFDLNEPLIPKVKLASLFEAIGETPPEQRFPAPVYDLQEEPVPENTQIDIRRIRKEGGALAVQKELSNFTCRGAIPMTQSIKRTAANKLLMRVRTMLRQFPPGDCSEVEWQDTVTAQHAASRRAVTASFAPQHPPLRPPALSAVSRCRAVGDNRIANDHIDTYLKVAPNHPRALLSKALRCLEARSDLEARQYLADAVKAQNRNRYVLWAYGAQEFDKGPEAFKRATAAFRIAVKTDYSDCVGNGIGWAALHVLQHYNDNPYYSFVAARRMRKCYELVRNWKDFLKRWEISSGEEEIFWIPSVVSADSPLIVASAFFLCLRAYKFSEKIMQCFYNGCGSRGSRMKITDKVTVDCNYIESASWLMRGQIDKALGIVEESIRFRGPLPILCQMRATCLMCAEGWNGECEQAFEVAERSDCVMNSALLLQAALGGMETNPEAAMQRAARAHKKAPSAHSALIIARIYMRLNDKTLAERWAAAAVKTEPLLADGWALLALLAMYEKNADKVRALLRTAKQAGPIDPDIKSEIKQMSTAVQVEILSDALVKDLCFCEYY